MEQDRRSFFQQLMTFNKLQRWLYAHDHIGILLQI